MKFSLKQRLAKPVIVRRVVGHSMEPTLRQSQLMIASGWAKVSDGSVVIAECADGTEVVKRFLADAELLVGDNAKDSLDYCLEDVTQFARVIWPGC